MEKTKERKESVKKQKSKEKPTIGDIVFRILVLFSILLVSVIMYVFYIRSI